MKKLISVVLCVAMLCCTMAVSAFSVNAVDNDETQELRTELYDICHLILNPPDYTGEPDPFYSVESYHRLQASAKVGLPVAENPDSTYEELKQAYDNLINVELCISSTNAQESYNFAVAEPFNANWWTESLWTEFQTKIADLKTALDGGDEKTIDTAYKAVNYTLNEACNSKKIHGDVNGDGEVTITDVTLIQKYCAELETFSMVQKFNLLNNYNYDNATRFAPKIDDATSLQKELIGLIDGSYYSKVYNDDYTIRNYVLAPVHYYGGYI